MRLPVVQALLVDNNRTPTPIRTRNLELMDIESHPSKSFSRVWRTSTNVRRTQTRLWRHPSTLPANQMAVSPKPVPATVAAESVISTRPLPAWTSPPADPMLAAIMAALDRIQSSVDSLDKRVKAVEKPAQRTKPPPASASAVSMPISQLHHGLLIRSLI
jgi:hypothetical protein